MHSNHYKIININILFIHIIYPIHLFET